VQLTFEHVDPEKIDAELLASAVVSVTPLLPDPEKAQFVWTGDLPASITSRTPDSPPYVAERLWGRALAMTLPRPDKECVLVVSAWPYAKREVLEAAGADPEGLEVTARFATRVLKHEGWHAAIHQRDESTGNIRSRLDLGFGAQGGFAASAGVAAEEYRVERALWTAGEGWDGSNSDNLEETLADVRKALLEAASPWRPSSPNAVWTAMEWHFHQLATRLGYVAGEWLAVTSPGIGQGVRESAEWVALLPDSSWAELSAAFEQFPPADVERPVDTLDAAVFRLARVLRTWASRVGFTFKDTPTGIHVSYEDPAAL
jgi:hypothetical protein